MWSLAVGWCAHSLSCLMGLQTLPCDFHRSVHVSQGFPVTVVTRTTRGVRVVLVRYCVRV
jgi:hypothetical protein